MHARWAYGLVFGFVLLFSFWFCLFLLNQGLTTKPMMVSNLKPSRLSFPNAGNIAVCHHAQLLSVFVLAELRMEPRILHMPGVALPLNGIASLSVAFSIPFEFGNGRLVEPVMPTLWGCSQEDQFQVILSSTAESEGSLGYMRHSQK